MNPTDPILSIPHHAGYFERFAARVTYWTGTTNAFIVALSLVLLWVVLGPHFHYSTTWQLVVNTSASIITFLMVLLIQRSQNREMLSLKIQLGELIASLQEANNTVINLDHLSEQQLALLHKQYQELSQQEVPTVAPPENDASPAEGNVGPA